MAQWSLTRKILMAFDVFVFVLLIVSGLKQLFGWDWGVYFPAILLFLSAAYLIVESHIKNYRTFKSQFGGGMKRNFHAFMNSLMFAFGILFVYIGIASIWGALAVPFIMLFNAWILIAGGVLAVLNIFNWI